MTIDQEGKEVADAYAAGFRAALEFSAQAVESVATNGKDNGYRLRETMAKAIRSVEISTDSYIASDAIVSERKMLRDLLNETRRWAQVYSDTLINVYHAKGVDGWLSIKDRVEAAINRSRAAAPTGTLGPDR